MSHQNSLPSAIYDNGFGYTADTSEYSYAIPALQPVACPTSPPTDGVLVDMDNWTPAFYTNQANNPELHPAPVFPAAPRSPSPIAGGSRAIAFPGLYDNANSTAGGLARANGLELKAKKKLEKEKKDREMRVKRLEKERKEREARNRHFKKVKAEQEKKARRAERENQRYIRAANFAASPEFDELSDRVQLAYIRKVANGEIPRKPAIPSRHRCQQMRIETPDPRLVEMCEKLPIHVQHADPEDLTKARCFMESDAPVPLENPRSPAKLHPELTDHECMDTMRDVLRRSPIEPAPQIPNPPQPSPVVQIPNPPQPSPETQPKRRPRRTKQSRSRHPLAPSDCTRGYKRGLCRCWCCGVLRSSSVYNNHAKLILIDFDLLASNTRQYQPRKPCATANIDDSDKENRDPTEQQQLSIANSLAFNQFCQILMDGEYVTPANFQRLRRDVTLDVIRKRKGHPEPRSTPFADRLAAYTQSQLAAGNPLLVAQNELLAPEGVETDESEPLTEAPAPPQSIADDSKTLDDGNMTVSSSVDQISSVEGVNIPPFCGRYSPISPAVTPSGNQSVNPLPEAVASPRATSVAMEHVDARATNDQLYEDAMEYVAEDLGVVEDIDPAIFDEIAELELEESVQSPADQIVQTEREVVTVVGIGLDAEEVDTEATRLTHTPTETGRYSTEASDDDVIYVGHFPGGSDGVLNDVAIVNDITVTIDPQVAEATSNALKTDKAIKARYRRKSLQRRTLTNKVRRKAGRLAK